VYHERSAKSKRTAWNREHQSNAITNGEGYHEQRTTKSKFMKGITNCEWLNQKRWRVSQRRGIENRKQRVSTEVIKGKEGDHN
jgi:hypothetical protein